MKKLKAILIFPLLVARVAWGIIVYRISGRTPPASYQSMIRLFCVTGGRSNDLMSWLLSLIRPPYVLPPAQGVLGELDDADLERIAADLRENGYHVFERRLPDEFCDRLLEFALNSECVVRSLEEGGSISRVPRYERGKPLGVRYDLLSDDVISNPDVQKLMADMSLIAVAQRYLGAQPVADVTAMWWNTAFSDRPSSEAAQLFHFDMDRIKWLKFFICITEVTSKTGPHTFVAKSHKTESVPPALLSAGYTRLTDEEVESHFNRADFMEFCAPRGTILAEDTRGLHKGKNVQMGDRLMFQVQFSNSLFGAAAEGGRFKQVHAPRLRELAARYPRLYSNFVTKDAVA